MPKVSPLPDYGNLQMKEIIMDRIHDKRDRKILYLYLVDGETIEDIAGMMDLNTKTVWKHIKDGKAIVFKHLPRE